MTEKSSNTNATTEAPRPKKVVGFLLGVGIVVLPLIFTWALLRKGHSTFARIVSFSWLAITIAVIAHHQPKNDLAIARANDIEVTHTEQVAQQSKLQSDQVKATVTSTSSALPQTLQSKWEYSEDRDQMRGTVTRYNNLYSENQLDFAFPYSGGSQASIQVREKAGKLAVMLIVDKGQFICNPFLKSTLAVKFDNKPVQHFDCRTAADGSANIIFVLPAKQFLNALKKSHHVIVEANFFQEGPRQMEFMSAGLDW